MMSFLQLLGQPVLARNVAAWLLVALLAVAVVRAIIGLLDAALDLREKWVRRSR